MSGTDEDWELDCTSSETKPMDSERLAEARDLTASGGLLEGHRLLVELLADRDLHAGLLLGLLAVIHRDGGHHTDAVGLEQSVADAKARWHERAQAIEDAVRGREHVERWYGCRWERLRDLLRETSLWSQAAAIMANGTADPHEPPTYAQQLNMAIHRAEAAEQALAGAHALADERVAAMKKERDDMREVAQKYGRERDEARAAASAAERTASAERATRERMDAQFCRTLDALKARAHGDDVALPSEARSIIDEVARLRVRVETEADDVERACKTELARALGQDPSTTLSALFDRISEQRDAVARLRARVRVEAEDVERAGVTRAHVEAWLRARGWNPDARDDNYSVWRHPERRGRPLVVLDDLQPLWAAELVRMVALDPVRSGFDILDEMAATEVT